MGYWPIKQQTLTVEFDQVTTDDPVILAGSMIDSALLGLINGRYHFKNIGADTAHFSLFEWMRKDELDIEETDNGDIATGTFSLVNVGLPYRYSRISISSAVAGAPGRLIGGVYMIS